MEKVKLAFFEFTSCEGCQLEVINQGQELLELLQYADIVTFREAMSEKSDDYSIAIVEGSISNDEQEKKLIDIRSKAKILIAIGACAVSGGVNSIKNHYPAGFVRKYVYGDKFEKFPSFNAKPLSSFVKVDHNIRGCPPRTKEFLSILGEILLGKNPFVPDYPVCVECKMKENPCLFDLGKICLGPVTRAGCDAWCPSYGDKCSGCRGLITEAAIDAHREILLKYKLTTKQILNEYNLYGTHSEDFE
ncbi:NADH:ubiquinone oxidoreductase [Candidatus Desantisbacteria bacterium]|nr:NADH:ubiquinone oxidoreductase [Candidatus Desantisbacteria bacterium]